ncbi:MAG TPA: DUF177 domain-containing protein [Firmicutes bacterium]|mgnify:FL=1|nr:DUF177 domain-containing protein [Bacillota bacterium]
MIPEIDVRGCIARKTLEGTLAFSYEADESLLDIPFVKFAGPVRAELTYRIFDDFTVEVKGTLAFRLEGSCSRCLEETSSDIVYEAEGYFARGEDDGETYGYTNGKVLLDDFLRDTLMFALPPRLLCKACEQWENE